ncbi:7895_t:CDS:2 [Diversispora eburnea]|uniref:7895_t:CDS:1 n=1 Tax=Diversispora eburnea TaxID=1213867 RepID=A0A9N9BGN9_9GLOM|nr:7895_t:CDS:2 [Diversispora eburnea]
MFGTFLLDIISEAADDIIKLSWNFIEQCWEYDLLGKVSLKEIKDSNYDILEFLKALFDIDLHNFLTMNFWDLGWETKIDILCSIVCGLESIHAKNLVHCDLHSGNLLVNYNYYSDMGMNLGLCRLENDLILNSDDENDIIYGSIPYIPPEILRGNKGNGFTREGNVYNFGGIMYEIVTAQQPFADQAHDTYLMIDICNGVRPKVPVLMLNWIPEWYLDLMYRCWSDDPSERPTSFELWNLFYAIRQRRLDNIVDNNVMQQLKIADENQKNTSKSQKQELFSYSSKIHSQSCYISRYIETLHGLNGLLEGIKSGESSGHEVQICGIDLPASKVCRMMIALVHGTLCLGKDDAVESPINVFSNALPSPEITKLELYLKRD